MFPLLSALSRFIYDMIDKKVLIMLGVLLVVLIIVILVLRGPQKIGVQNNLRVGGHQYSVEIADSIITQARGLSGRTSLSEGTGMLFVFKSADMRSFWMKDMQFPLDFVWINSGKVIGVTENVPFVPAYATQSPPSSADMVLELNAGTVARDSIKIGDSVELQNAK